jgi:hypothetical protein
MLLKLDGGYVQFFDEKGIHKNWYFTVICKDGEVGLISVNDLGTGLPIDLGERVSRCIFVPPAEYLELIEEMEALKEHVLDDINIEAGMKYHDEVGAFYDGWEKAMDVAMRLVASRASPPPGVE